MRCATIRKDTQTFKLPYFLKMTVEFNRELMIGMLRKGQTGDQILQILNAIVPNSEQEVVENLNGMSDVESVMNEIADYQEEQMREEYTVEV